MHLVQVIYLIICGQSLHAFDFLLASANHAGSEDTGEASGVENLFGRSFARVTGTVSVISTVEENNKIS